MSEGWAACWVVLALGPWLLPGQLRARNVEDFSVHGSPMVPDAHVDKVDRREM